MIIPKRGASPSPPHLRAKNKTLSSSLDSLTANVNTWRYPSRGSTTSENISTEIELKAQEYRINQGMRKVHIVLTGSTGNLGAYLLDTLFRLPESTYPKIICLNRSNDARERQERAQLSRGLSSVCTRSERVEFLKCDFSSHDLDLSTKQQDEIFPSEKNDFTTFLLHNAWPVDFNRHFSSFEPNIHGVHNLIKRAGGCPPSLHPYHVCQLD